MEEEEEGEEEEDLLAPPTSLTTLKSTLTLRQMIQMGGSVCKRTWCVMAPLTC